MADRLFDLSEVPEVPLFREPRERKIAAKGSWSDARFQNDYPPEWHLCATCGGHGRFARSLLDGTRPALLTEGGEMIVDADGLVMCGDCCGAGSLKARIRFEAGHRCVRCQHPYVPKGDAALLGLEPSGMEKCETCKGNGRVEMLEHCPDCKGKGKIWTPWSACDEECVHGGPIRFRVGDVLYSVVKGPVPSAVGEVLRADYLDVEAEWRILTVHHLDGDKANCRWWNLAPLCQRCHLEIQAKIVMDRVYPFEHSEWFRPYVAGYYAFVYLQEDLTRPEVEARMDELLALEQAA